MQIVLLIEYIVFVCCLCQKSPLSTIQLERLTVTAELGMTKCPVNIAPMCAAMKNLNRKCHTARFTGGNEPHSVASRGACSFRKTKLNLRRICTSTQLNVFFGTEERSFSACNAQEPV